MTIILIGFMGSGKTTIGRRLAKMLHYKHVDTDRLFEQKHHMSIQTFFERFGEEAFRQSETEILKKSLQKKRQVLSTGGGIVLRAENRALLQTRANVFFLETSAEESFRRLQHSHIVRPLFLNKTMTEFKKLYRQRYMFYRSAAKHVILTKGKSPQRIAEEIAAIYRQKSKKKF